MYIRNIGGDRERLSFWNPPQTERAPPKKAKVLHKRTILCCRSEIKLFGSGSGSNILQTYILTKIFFGVYKKTCKHSNKLLKQTIKNSLREPIFIISLFTNQWFKSGFGKIIGSGQTRIHHTVNKYSKRTTVLITKIQITVLKFSILHT